MSKAGGDPSSGISRRREAQIDPPGESRKPLRNRQRIIVDDIVDTRLGSQRGDCVIDVNDCHHTVGLNT